MKHLKDDEEADAQLAQQLQDEEYNAPEQKKMSPNKRLAAIDIDTDDSHLTSLSSPEHSDFSDAEPLAKKRKFNSLKSTPKKSIKSSHITKSKGKLPVIFDPDLDALEQDLDSVDDSVDTDDLSELSDDDDLPTIAQSNATPDPNLQINQDEQDLALPLSRRRGRRFPRSREPPIGGRRAFRQRQKLEKAHPEILTMWNDLEAVPKIKAEQAAQPQSINRTLKSFQLEGLNWMQKQEQSQWKGGLLGDEMGMGKTIQAVSLIMSDFPQKDPTLVVVPPVALMQWQSEINEYTNGKLSVLVYHGTNAKAKHLSVKDLKKYNVIMISYSSLESIYRKETKGWSRGSKIIKEDSAIHAIHFHRLVLDEAHSIKSRTAGVAKACFALNGSYRWCLSGTPVQNRIGEFFSLLRFLDVTPFANYFCKSCDCSSPHWSVSADYKCTHCDHRSLDHVSVFNQEILNPITSTDADAIRTEAFRKLRLLTDRIMLRRMKRDYTASMELPPKEVIIHNEFFGDIESDFASSIMSSTVRKFDTYVSHGVMLDNYANIFGLIMQMRQTADHPDLILKKRAEGGQNVLVCNICDEAAEEAIRSKCRHEFCRSCAKDYVRQCEANSIEPDCPRCHIGLSIDLDQPDIEQDEESVKKSSIINRIKMENWTSSTKIEMLVYDLWKLRSQKTTTKSIVFSQFTSMLQLIEWRLRRAGFNTVMLDGSMTPAQRQKSIEYFMNNTEVEVFLVSLKAGGVALNLTEASRVFIVDPWWNPAAEWQSADRCHRIGQKRPCVITRLCVEDSIESRIVMLQEKKAQMIQGTVNGDDMAMEKLTPQDMQFLFRGS